MKILMNLISAVQKNYMLGNIERKIIFRKYGQMSNSLKNVLRGQKIDGTN